MRSEREKGGDHVQGDSKGRSPWRAFGDFPRDGKVTRVQGGAPAGGRRGYQPRKITRGAGRSAEGAQPPRKEALGLGREKNGERRGVHRRCGPSHIAGCRSLRSCKWTRRGPLQRSGKLGIIRRLFTIS